MLTLLIAVILFAVAAVLALLDRAWPLALLAAGWFTLSLARLLDGPRILG